MTDETKIMIFNKEVIDVALLWSRPEEELGFDWEVHCEQVILGQGSRHDAGLIKIDKLIATLELMKESGATHAACDWDDDHQELEVHGIKYTVADEEQRRQYFDKILVANRAKRDREIKALEERLSNLKNQ